jgi:hypothetical protein
MECSVEVRISIPACSCERNRRYVTIGTLFWIFIELTLLTTFIEDVEYEYRNPQQVPRGQSSNPTSTSALSTIQESSNIQEAYTPDNYTYNVQSMTDALRRTDLNSSIVEAPAQTQTEQARPTSTGITPNPFSSMTPGYNYGKLAHQTVVKIRKKII